MSISQIARSLIKPSDTITDHESRRRARLLSATILPIPLLAPPGIFVSTFAPERLAVTFLFFMSIIIYLLSRTRYYATGAIIGYITMAAIPHFLLANEAEYSQYTIITWFSWFNLSLLLGSIWMPLKRITLLWSINLFFILLMPITTIPELTYLAIAPGLAQYLLLGSIILLAAGIHNHDLKSLVTETRNAEFANRSKTIFLANMSHEIRTPLHGILSYAEFGLDQLKDSDQEKLIKYFSRIRSSGTRLRNLLNDLLDLSKLEESKMEFRFAATNLCTIVEECIEEQRASLQEKNINLQFVCKPEYMDIECDQARIGQVVMNLLNNALKFTPENSTIDITCEPAALPTESTNSSDSLRFSIKDEGPGVPDSELDLIFDKFTQSSLNQYASGSTGLGLAISREIILAHNGIIWAQNSPIAGAVFSFILPKKQGAH